MPCHPAHTVPQIIDQPMKLDDSLPIRHGCNAHWSKKDLHPDAVKMTDFEVMSDNKIEEFFNRKHHRGDKAILRPFYFHKRIFCITKQHLYIGMDACGLSNSIPLRISFNDRSSIQEVQKRGIFFSQEWKKSKNFLHIEEHDIYAGLIIGLCPANGRWRYFVTTSLIGWTQP